jgi:adenosylcobinamide kinase/adenosylcobinamide-phosphate guanylyltransferase
MHPRHHLILGGQRSGKSRQAERMARAWLERDARHEVLVVATAWASDDEMRERIERHRRDRDPAFAVVESALGLGATLRAQSAPQRLIVVDCLTLWVSQALMPDGLPESVAELPLWDALRADFLSAMEDVASPLVLVSNEIGAGVVPMGAEVRRVVDELGRLHQDVAQRCGQLTWMVAGQPFTREVERWT